MPQNAEAWKLIVDEALNASSLSSVSPSDDAIRELPKELSARWDVSHMTTFVHCEVVLAVHFRQQKKKFPQLVNPVQHIGVSKLSCQACNVFLEVLNSTAQHYDPRFVTRGCHGKAYFPWPRKVYPNWGFPTLKLSRDVTASIQSEFITRMVTEFIQQLTNHSRSLSDRPHPDDRIPSSVPDWIGSLLAEDSVGTNGT